MSRRPKRTCEEPFLDKCCHVVDLKNVAVEGIRNFFKDKSWFAGGSIPECEIESDDSVDLVLRTPFNEETFSFIHNNCLPKVPCPKNFVDQGVPWSVAYLIKLLADLKRCSIPKDFQPGFVLLYFKLCKGVKVIPPPIV